MNSLLVRTGFAAILAGAVLWTGCTCAAKKSQSTDGKGSMNIQESKFGTMPDGQQVSLYTLTNAKGAVAKITNYGAIVTELWVPDKNGNLGDIVLGYDNLAAYLKETPYFGCYRRPLRQPHREGQVLP
jgi:aldose 1-epimerase